MVHAYVISLTVVLVSPTTTSSDLLDPFRWGSLSSQNGPIEWPSICAGYFWPVFSLFVQGNLWAFTTMECGYNGVVRACVFTYD